MGKNTKRINILIRKKLIGEIRKSGIKRINPQSILFLDLYILKKLDKIFEIVKDELVIRGKETLTPEDIKRVLDAAKKEDYFEV